MPSHDKVLDTDLPYISVEKLTSKKKKKTKEIEYGNNNKKTIGQQEVL